MSNGMGAAKVGLDKPGNLKQGEIQGEMNRLDSIISDITTVVDQTGARFIQVLKSPVPEGEDDAKEPGYSAELAQSLQSFRFRLRAAFDKLIDINKRCEL